MISLTCGSFAQALRWCAINGFPATGNNGFGISKDNGRNLVPFDGPKCYFFDLNIIFLFLKRTKMFKMQKKPFVIFPKMIESNIIIQLIWYLINTSNQNDNLQCTLFNSLSFWRWLHCIWRTSQCFVIIIWSTHYVLDSMSLNGIEMREKKKKCISLFDAIAFFFFFQFRIILGKEKNIYYFASSESLIIS